MTKLTAALLIAALALSQQLSARTFAAQPPPTPSSTVRTAVQAAYEGMGTSFQAHDLERFMAYFQPDYVDIDENGRHLTKKETRRGYSDQLGQLKSIQSQYVVRDIQTMPNGMLAEMRLHSHGTGEKRILFAKIRGHFTDELWVRDLWVNTPQGWRIQNRQTLKDDLSAGP